MEKPIVYPLPLPQLATLAESIFTPLKEHDCVTCMFPAGGGKRTLIKFFLKEEKILQKLFGKQYEKSLFVYLDPDDILDISNREYLQLLLDKLYMVMKMKKLSPLEEQGDNPLVKLKNNLANLTMNGYDIIFLLNDFEFTLSLSPSIYLNLETIMTVNKSKITYLFLSTINIYREDFLERLSNLKFGVTQKIIYYPIQSHTIGEYILSQYEQKLGKTLSPEVKKVLFRYCGAHPQLLKYAFYILTQEGKEFSTKAEKAESLLCHHDQLLLICEDIWTHLSEEEKEVLIEVATTKGTDPTYREYAVKYLLNLGLIQHVKDRSYTCFGLVFEQFTKNRMPKQYLHYDPKTQQLYFNGERCEDKFTLQEFKLLSYFLTHDGELVTRDQVAEALWGRNYLEKYSDWSIDKVISILRTKLDSIGFSSDNLVTLKRRGFRFTNTT